MKKSFIFIIIILSVAFGTYSYFVSSKQSIYSIDNNNEIYIGSKDDFIYYTENYSLCETAYLTTNITLDFTFKSIGQKDNLFNSTFDGCGYTITLEKDAIGIPLFNIIGTDGVVKNLELIINECNVNSTALGLISIQNKGTIKNINLLVNKIIIKNDTIFGCISSINSGSISFCYIDTNIENQIYQSRKSSIIGCCCGYNDGKIRSVIVNAEFNNFSSFVENNALYGITNSSYGMICGINNKSKNEINSSFYFQTMPYKFSDNNYTSSISSLTEETLLRKYLFDNRIWQLTNDSSNRAKIKLNLMDGVTV